MTEIIDLLLALSQEIKDLKARIELFSLWSVFMG